jgi:hypothetical protein
MSETSDAWKTAGEQLSGLGQKLKQHYEDETDGESTRRREDVESALRTLGNAVEGAFEAIGKAAKDPAVKDDVKVVGGTLKTALGVTFAQVSEDLRGVFAERKGDRKTDDRWGSATDEPTPPTSAEQTPPAPEVPPAPEAPAP